MTATTWAEMPETASDLERRNNIEDHSMSSLDATQLQSLVMCAHPKERTASKPLKAFSPIVTIRLSV